MKISYFKFLTSFLMLALIISLFSCRPGPKIPVAGQARGQDMLTLLPAETSAFIVANWNQIMNQRLVQKAIAEEKELQPYRQKAEAFFNPEQDLFFVALAMTGEIKKPLENLVLLTNLKYDQQKLVPESDPDSTLKNYEEIPYFPFIETEGFEACLAFLDDSNLALGSEKAIKKVIDTYKGKTPNLLSQPEIKPYLKDINMNALTFTWLTLPAELLREETSENPVLQLAKKVRYISSFSDYRQPNYLTELKVYAEDKKDHQQIAETLTGLKALGLGLSGETPEIGQALDSLEITSSEKYVKIFISLNEELLEKLKRTWQEKNLKSKSKETDQEI
ncbi:MAG: hypothetical protein PHQ25_03680 [Acidobacteriota bacterium]|nr:hypothetical protein [Acidobacteriota bacterium]MDW3228782.1 hypothetical protein [Acidobacteriota bacterium]